VKMLTMLAANKTPSCPITSRGPDTATSQDRRGIPLLSEPMQMLL